MAGSGQFRPEPRLDGFFLKRSFEGPGDKRLEIEDPTRTQVHVAVDEMLERTGVCSLSRVADGFVIESQYYDEMISWGLADAGGYWNCCDLADMDGLHKVFGEFYDGDIDGLFERHRFEDYAAHPQAPPPVPAPEPVVGDPDRTAVMRWCGTDTNGDTSWIFGVVHGYSSYGQELHLHRFDPGRTVTVCHGTTPIHTAVIKAEPHDGKIHDPGWAKFTIEPGVTDQWPTGTIIVTQTRVPVAAMRGYVLEVIGNANQAHRRDARDAMINNFGDDAAENWLELTRHAMGINDESRRAIEMWLIAEWAWLGLAGKRQPAPEAYAQEIVNAFWVVPPTQAARAWRQTLRSHLQALHRSDPAPTPDETAAAIRADFEAVVNPIERVELNWELARVAESPLRPDDRYDALVLIQQYRIHQAAPALQRALRRPEQLTPEEATWIRQILTLIEDHTGEAPRGYPTFDPPVPPRPTI